MPDIILQNLITEFNSVSNFYVWDRIYCKCLPPVPGSPLLPHWAPHYYNLSQLLTALLNPLCKTNSFFVKLIARGIKTQCLQSWCHSPLLRIVLHFRWLQELATVTTILSIISLSVRCVIFWFRLHLHELTKFLLKTWKLSYL